MFKRFDHFGRVLANLNSNSPASPTSLRVGSISNVIAFLVNVIVGFLLIPYVIRHLGLTDYGIWALVSSFIGYYGLLNFGVQSAISRYVAYYTAQGETESLSEIVSTAFFYFLLVGQQQQSLPGQFLAT